ncbi:hypothetical protein Tco_1360459 [Tanacetum coccineum]
MIVLQIKHPSSNKTYNKPEFHTNSSSSQQYNQNDDNNHKDYMGKYKALRAKLALLTRKIDVVSKNKSEKGLVDESFDWDEEYISFVDEGVTRIKAFMAIVEDEPIVGKTDARINLENKSLKDEISHIKKVIDKWTSSKVTLDQLLTEQIPGNIVRALGGRGKRKETVSSKEVMFTKDKNSPFEMVPEVTSDTECECDNQEPLPPLPKLLGVEPISTSNDVIPTANLI